MAKLTLADISAGYAAVTTINSNNALIEAALENTLSRDGTSPNTMGANLDMNSNRIVNVTDPTNNQDAATKAYVDAIDGLNPASDETVSGNWTFSGTTTFTGAIVAASMTLTTALAETDGGTGTDTYTQGDILYSDASNSLAKLGIGTLGQVLQVSASGIPEWSAAAGGGATQLSDLSDVNTSTATNRFVLVADGVDFESRLLVEADISDLQSYLLNIVEDTTPQLGGALDANSNPINMGDQKINRPVIEDYGIENNSQSSSSGAITLDLTTGNAFETTLTENITSITISNPPASGTYGEFIWKVTQDGTGGRTISFPAAVKFQGGTAPTISTAANAVDILVFKTWDGGTTWYCDYGQTYS